MIFQNNCHIFAEQKSDKQRTNITKSNDKTIINMKSTIEKLKKYLKQGEYKDIALLAGCSAQTLRNALKKERIEDLSVKELLAYEQFIYYAEDKKRHLERLSEHTEQYA